MSNIEKIMFDAKYSISYMNGYFVISGFTHVKSLKIKDEEMEDFLEDYSISHYNEQEWNDLIEELK